VYIRRRSYNDAAPPIDRDVRFPTGHRTFIGRMMAARKPLSLSLTDRRHSWVALAVPPLGRSLGPPLARRSTPGYQFEPECTRPFDTTSTGRPRPCMPGRVNRDTTDSVRRLALDRNTAWGTGGRKWGAGRMIYLEFIRLLFPWDSRRRSWRRAD